jgi:hypothetical protein
VHCLLDGLCRHFWRIFDTLCSWTMVVSCGFVSRFTLGLHSWPCWLGGEW